MKIKFKKIPLSELVFYISAFIMTFSIFMFYMTALKWVNKPSYARDVTPNFFNLIFGDKGALPFTNWPTISGIVFMFIFHIILIGTCITTSGLLIFKKISKHTAVCILIGIAVLAVMCAVLAFCTNLMISKKYHYPDLPESPTYKGQMKLGFGAYIYGFTMILGALGSIGAFILDHYNK